ncbi:MAG: cysteine desulfurase [Coriobacteriia bacterium]|nr:cysteine desulfurase [Coriobacteriia bacterium]
MTPRVYLDYAATTPVDERVLDAMLPYLKDDFGNPSSLYAEGRAARAALEEARECVASLIGAAHPNEVAFTAGGTEGDNAAIIGIAHRARPERGHVVISAFEHHAVLEAADRLQKQGWDVTRLRPDACGIVQPGSLAKAMRDDTTIVAVMHANNELGTVQPVRKLAEISHEGGAYFHTDAAQSLGKIPFDVDDLAVDSAAFSGHKIYAPKGTGALFVRRRTPFEPLIVGGGQEFKKRSGTQSVAGAVAFATALQIMLESRLEEEKRLGLLRDRIVTDVIARIEGARETVSTEQRLPNIAHLIFSGTEGEALLLQLDEAGIAVSTGSACSSGSTEPSHVLSAIGCPIDDAHASIRVSVGRYTTADDVDCFLEILPGIVERLRSLSPEARRGRA